MKQKIKVRLNTSEMDVLPRWDLSISFYKDLKDPQVEIDKEALKYLSKELSLYRDYVAELQPHELSIMLKKFETMVSLARKLFYFAFLYEDTHKNDEEAAQFKAKVFECVSEHFKTLGFIHFELNDLPEWKMIEFLNHPKLQRWVPWLKSIFSSYWQLDEAQAFIIDQKSIVSSSWDRLYNETIAGLKFRLKGKTLTQEEMYNKLSSSDPEIRAAALKEMNDVYKKNARVLAMCYNMIMKDKQTDDSLWGLQEPVQSSLASNRISKETLLAMVNEVVDSYIPLSHRFYKLLSKIAKIEQPRYCDRNVNPFESKKRVSWPDCVQKVLEAYGSFSVQYMELAMSIINAGIIDVPIDKNKRGGAYCVSGSNPYILLNFSGTESDVNTFAHELGHGVHHLLASELGVLNDSTPTALAEVASEFAENLVFQDQLEEASTNLEKLGLLISRVQDMIGSIHRQVAFFKFEERTHRERAEGELSVKQLNQIWREEVSRYLGFDIGEEAEYMWMGISHIFNSPYYVYSYAFAGLVVNNLIKAYEDWEKDGAFELREDFADLYMDMLSNTGVEDFKSLLKPFEIDADDPKFWHKGLDLIKSYIDEIEELAKAEKLI